jgi:hypothetical protein
MMCGKRWPIQYQIQSMKTGGDKMEEVKRYPSGKTGVCINCLLTKYIAAADGHCAACHEAVKGIKPGTPEYTTALSDAKKRIMVKQKQQRNKNKVKANPVKPAITPAVNLVHVSELSSPMQTITGILGANPMCLPHSSGDIDTPEKTLSKPSTVSHIDAAAALSNIITKMQAEREYHLSMSERYAKAISALNY